MKPPAPEASLAASESLYRATFDKAALGIAHLGLDGRWLRVNDRLCAITGYTREELLGRQFGDITHPDDLPANLAALEALREGRTAEIVYEKRYRRNDGRFVWVKATATLMRDTTGKPLNLICTLDDISDRKRVEIAMRESEARLHLGFEAAGLGIAEWNLARGVFRVDQRVSVLSRGLLPPDVWLSVDGPERSAWHARIHKDDFMAVWPARQAQLEGRSGTRSIAYRVTHPDGGWHWISHATMVVERDEAGNGVRLIDVLQDVTDRMETEWRVRAALEGLPQLAWISRRDGYSLYYNRHFAEFFGEDLEPDFESRMARVHPKDVPILRADIKHAFKQKVPLDTEARLRRHDGAWRWHRMRRVVLDTSEPDGLAVGIAIDIHDAKIAGQALEAANADLERRVAERTRALTEAANELAAEMARREAVQAALLQSQKLEALGRLTGGVAHDLNNVLAAISGSYELIRRRTSDPTLLRLVNLGAKGADRAAVLVRQLLAFARQESLRPEIVDTAALLAQIEALCRTAVGAAIRCILDVERGVWPVLIDSQRLEMALLNLAVNARDAMKDGGTLTMSARNTRDDGDYVAIDVADTGTGMTPDVLAHACEPFFTTKPRGEGTGLGLASARGFVEQSGGLLRIDSREGEGTRVTILLPRARVAPARALVTKEDGTLPQGDGVVLLVDDDEHARPVTAAQLRDMGYTVIEAADAVDATARATDAVDVLVTDVIMPGDDGPTLAGRLRAARPGLPVLFITGHAGTHKLAGERVLAKPFTARALGEAIGSALGRE